MRAGLTALAKVAHSVERSAVHLDFPMVAWSVDALGDCWAAAWDGGRVGHWAAWWAGGMAPETAVEWVADWETWLVDAKAACLA